MKKRNGKTIYTKKDIRLLTMCKTHWMQDNRHAAAYREIKIDSLSCALCAEYLKQCECNGCPIFEHTGKPLCIDTPWVKVKELLQQWLCDDKKPVNFELSVQKEIDFLDMLLKQAEAQYNEKNVTADYLQKKDIKMQTNIIIKSGKITIPATLNLCSLERVTDNNAYEKKIVCNVSGQKNIKIFHGLICDLDVSVERFCMNITCELLKIHDENFRLYDVAGFCTPSLELTFISTNFRRNK